jgi:hypothetical protein
VLAVEGSARTGWVGERPVQPQGGPAMATAAIYGLLASSSFVVGVALGLATKPPRRLLAVVIAFGAGVLVSALTFDLMGEAFEKETGAYAIVGFLVGGGYLCARRCRPGAPSRPLPQTHRPRPPRRSARGRGQAREHRGGRHHRAGPAGRGADRRHSRERRHRPQPARRGPQPRDRAARGGVPRQCSREPGQHGGHARGRALARLHHRCLDRGWQSCVCSPPWPATPC